MQKSPSVADDPLKIFPPLAPLRSKINPVPPSQHIFYDPHLRTALLRNCFPSGLSTKTLRTLLSLSCILL